MFFLLIGQNISEAIFAGFETNPITIITIPNNYLTYKLLPIDTFDKRQQMKNHIINFLSNIKFINNYYTGIATVFMLHRVYPFENNKLSSNEYLRISPEFLDEFIFELKSNGYEIINLDRLHEILLNGQRTGKKIVLTLDDGYKDNFTHAYPIFANHNVPFTIYITTSFPEKKGALWWYILEDLLLEHDELILSNGLSFQCRSLKEKELAFSQIHNIIMSLQKDDFLRNLNKLFNHYNVDWQRKCGQLMMNWNQIRILSDNELCRTGGHTLGHFALNKLKKNEIETEVLEANRLLRNKIGRKIGHFAYPFGSSNEIGKRECDIIKQFNFKTATTTRNGNIFLKHKQHLECLPRIYLGENFNLRDIGRIKRKRIVYL